MAKRTLFSELTKGFSHEQRDDIDVLKHQLRTEMTLAELRSARRLTQEAVASYLDVGQSAVAKLEKRADIYISNLRRFIEATGGTLEIRARFADGDVVITNFEEIGGSHDEGMSATGVTKEAVDNALMRSRLRS